MKLIGSRSAVRSPEFHKRKQREGILKVSAVTLILFVIFVVPVFVLRSERLQISEIEISGNNVTQASEIEQIIGESLSGRYLWLIPKSSSPLVKRSELERALTTAIPRLSFAGVSLSGTKTISVSVTERRPFALYCEDVSDTVNPYDCFFIDGAGYIFSEAPDFSGGVYLIYSAEPLLEDPLGKQFLPEERFRDLSGLLRDLPLLDIEPNVVLNKGDEYSIQLKEGAEIMLRSDEDMESAYINLESFLRGAKFKAADFARLLYIDLRFDNKVFYKFEGE